MLLGIPVPAEILVDSLLLGTIHMVIFHQQPLLYMQISFMHWLFVSGASSRCSLSE
jgi:hypothetical protein